ncbi:MAG: VanZ family protein [Thermodesulfobacteriota bacterium]
MRRALLHIIPLAVYMAVIFVASIRPMPGPGVDQGDKVLHFLAYAVMGWLTVRALFPLPSPPGAGGAGGGPVQGPPRWLAPLSVGATFSYGALIEVVQSFVPSRTGDPLDALANGLGGVTGVYACIRVMRLFRARTSQG